MGYVPFQRAGSSLLKKSWRTKFDLTVAPGARGLFLLYLLDSSGQIAG